MLTIATKAKKTPFFYEQMESYMKIEMWHLNPEPELSKKAADSIAPPFVKTDQTQQIRNTSQKSFGKTKGPAHQHAAPLNSHTYTKSSYENSCILRQWNGFSSFLFICSLWSPNFPFLMWISPFSAHILFEKAPFSNMHILWRMSRCNRSMWIETWKDLPPG